MFQPQQFYTIYPILSSHLCIDSMISTILILSMFIYELPVYMHTLRRHLHLLNDSLF